MEIGMGRKSLAARFYEDLEGEEERDGTWLVLYDFKGVKPSSKFWSNIARLVGLSGGGSLIQYSVFMTDGKRAALAMVMLVRHYGGEVAVFKGERFEV